MELKAIYGRKVGMTRVFGEKGTMIPVTVLEVLPNVIHQVKTPEVDNYSAIQVGIGSQKAQRLTKPENRHFAKAKKGFPKVAKEIRLDKYFQGQTFELGSELTLDGLFEKGTRVDVVGTTIGKGFAGVIKRHGMKGAQTMTHGTHEYFRHGGSIGCRKFPGRVWKNKRMPGHMGVKQRMQEGLEVVDIRPADNLLLIRGSVPGPKNGTVFVRTSLKCS